MNDFLTIGNFAAATGIPASALRFYDQQGLLPPAVVDPSSGYRYYSPALVERGILLSELRSSGLGLDDVRRILTADADERPGILAAIIGRTMDEQEERTDRLRRLAEDLAGATGTAGFVVPGPELKTALSAVDPLIGDGRIVLRLVDATLYCLATNRYALVAWPVPVDLQRPGRWSRQLVESPPALPRHDSSVLAAVSHDEDSFPDHRPMTTWADLPHVQILTPFDATSSWTQGEEAITFDPALLGLARSVLPTGEHVLRWRGTGTPAVLSPAVNSAIRVAVMPLRAAR